jgi:hypothetical protein
MPAKADQFIALVTCLTGTAASYYPLYFPERDAAYCKAKLTYYSSFIESVNSIVKGNVTQENYKLYAMASNNLPLFSPQSVIEAHNFFQSEATASNLPSATENHNNLLSSLILAILQDVCAPTSFLI